MINLSNKMAEKLAQNQTALKEVNKLASLKNLDNSKENLLKNEEVKSVEEIALKLLDKLAKGDLSKVEVARIIQKNNSLEPKENLSQELKKLVQMLEKIPEFKEIAKSLKAFLKPVVELANPEKTLPLQIKNSGILLEANLKSEIVQNPLPKTLNLLLDELKLHLDNSKQLNLPTSKELKLLVENIKSQPILLKNNTEKIIQNLLKNIQTIKPNLDKSLNLQLSKSLKSLENLEKFIQHIALKSTKKTNTKEILAKDFQKISNAIDKVFDKLSKNLDQRISNLKQSPENIKIKENLNEIKSLLKEIISQKNEAKPDIKTIQKEITNQDLKQNIKQQDTKQDTNIQAEKESLNLNKLEKNTIKTDLIKDTTREITKDLTKEAIKEAIKEDNKNPPNKEQIQKTQTDKDLKTINQNPEIKQSPKEQILNPKNEIKANLNEPSNTPKQENIIKEQEKIISAKEIVKERLMSDKELKAEQFLRTQNKTAIPQTKETEQQTKEAVSNQIKSTAIPAKNVLEGVKITTQNFTKNYTQNTMQNLSQQITQNTAESTIETIKQETLMSLEDKIKIVTKKLESTMQIIDKKFMLLNETNEQAKHLLKNFEHFAKDLPTKTLTKLNDLPANLQNDVKNILLQLEQAAQNSKSPNSQNISNLTNRLISQIEMHQFISYVGDIAHCYVPYLWDGMKGGHMSFKRGEQEKFYCKIDLNFQKYGQILIMLGLHKSKFLDISISMQSDELRGKIQEDLQSLKVALNSVGLIVKHLSISKLDKQEEKKINYQIYSDLDLGMNLRA